jgi:PAS domain S-box-containing protein
LVSIHDKDFKIVRVNSAFADAFKMKPEEITGRFCYELIHGTKEPPSFCPHKKTLDTKKPQRTEFFEPRLGVEIEASTSPIFDENGRIIASVHIAKDITERKKAEKKQEKLLHEKAERIKELRCIYGVAKSIQKRETLEAIFRDVVALIPPGWQYPEITRAKVFFNGEQYISEPFEETQWKQTSNIVVGGELCGSVVVYYLEERPVLDEGPFFKEERNLIDGIAQTLSEAIERKQAKEQLRKTRERLEYILTTTPATIYTCEVEGNWAATFMSENIRKQFAYEPNQFLEDPNFWAAHIHPDDRQRVLAGLSRLLEDDFHVHEYRFLHKDGSYRWVHDETRLIRDEQAKPLECIGYLVDITDRKKAEQELEAVNRDLMLTAKKLEESNRQLQDFVYIASHDLREPLRKISSFGGLLQDSLGGSLAKDDLENLDFMIDGSERMTQMIEGLLAYSHIDTQEVPFEVVDLNEIVEQLQQLELAEALEETGGTIEIPQPLPKVQSNLIQIRQLLQNLIGNAIRYHRDQVRPQIVIRAKQIDNDKVRIEVRDNGIGIEPEYHNDIFTMFRRLHSRRKYEGAGIGLAVCKKIVERHNGQIGVESKGGEGSTFWFTLSAANEAIAASKVVGAM